MNTVASLGGLSHMEAELWEQKKISKTSVPHHRFRGTCDVSQHGPCRMWGIMSATIWSLILSVRD